MFKKLDKLILKAFIGPFVATFFITVLVLVMQFFWLYIDDFVGKGLGVGVIFEFIWYQSAALVPLALPLAVLLSSLMTFGNLGESYELVAIRSAGISLLRFMRPLFVLTAFICVVAFLFSNYIIPVANLKSRTLLTDIVFSKPSFDLKEGVFYDKISGFAIKIGKKEKNDSVIRDVIIYEQSNGVQDNFIVASDGIMRVSDNKRFLEFHLKNGWRYEERTDNRTLATDYIRLGFKEYKKNFDLSSFGFQQRTDDSLNRQNAKMFSMRQLNQAIDSLQGLDSVYRNRERTEVFSYINFVRYLDSNWHFKPGKIAATNYDAFVPDSVKSFIQPGLSNRLSSMKASNDVVLQQYEDHQKNIRIHQIEWHRKISLSVACLVLFLIGAPLGSIIRKGGIGSPLIFAIVFFMVFYFTSTTGEKFAREGKWDSLTGMWFSTMMLVPLGVFLTWKAMHDSQMFNKEFYRRVFRRLPFRKKRKEDSVL
ncbi:MAG: LptF/LptG family permease [Flavisolibacter sp.]